jgi:hypothetical protein
MAAASRWQIGRGPKSEADDYYPLKKLAAKLKVAD